MGNRRDGSPRPEIGDFHPPARGGLKKKGKSLVSYVKPYKVPLLVFVVCVFFTSFSIIAIGKGLVFFVDEGLSSGNKDVLFQSLLLLFGIVGVLSLAIFGRFFLITYYSEKIISDIRADIFKNLLGLDARFYEKNKVGELVSRITSDLSVLQSSLASSVSIFLRNSLIFIGCLIFLISIHPRLTLLVFAAVPVIVLPIIMLGKRVRKLSQIVQDKTANMSAIMEENVTNIKLVQSFVRESYVFKLFETSLASLLDASFKRILLRSFLTVTVILIVFCGVALILYQGGNAVFSGMLTNGEFLSFLFYTIMLAGSFGAMAEVFGGVQKARGASVRLLELLNFKSEIINGEKKLEEFKDLEFRDVSFTYPTRKLPSLKNINFKLKKGEVVSFVGESGAGKTTMLELLQRFYDVSEGQVLINGEDVRNYDTASLRAVFSHVDQGNLVFSNSVRENLAFADLDASEEEIKDAIFRAKSEKFVDKLPEKLDSVLGEKGVRISMGEKQRLAIARAILKNSPVFLFDEPTSNLDGINETLLDDLLLEIKDQKTMIIIAHRLSTVKKLEKIIVFHDGEIVETGSHDELIKKKKGFYKKLIEYQKL